MSRPLKPPSFVARLRALWERGDTVDAIAAELNIAPLSVYQYRRKYKLPARPWAHGRATAPTPEKRWTPAEEDRLVALWRARKSTEEIADALGRTRQSVRNHRYLLGLKRRTLKGKP